MKEQKAATRTGETVMISRAEYEELKSQNEWLMEQLRLVRKKQFGASREQTTRETLEYLGCLFNEASAGMEMERKNQIGAQRSGADLERRGKGAERGMPAGRSETERTLP